MEALMEGLESVWEGETISEQDSKEMAEADLVPAGKWEGQLEPVSEEHIKTVTTEAGDHPLEGKKVVRLHAKLFTEQGERHFFFDAYPSKVIATSAAGGTYTRQESKNAECLYKATKLHGRPFSDVITFAQNNRLVYDIKVKPERTDAKTGNTYPASNQLKAAYPVSA